MPTVAYIISDVGDKLVHSVAVLPICHRRPSESASAQMFDPRQPLRKDSRSVVSHSFDCSRLELLAVMSGSVAWLEETGSEMKQRRLPASNPSQMVPDASAFVRSSNLQPLINGEGPEVVIVVVVSSVSSLYLWAHRPDLPCRTNGRKKIEGNAMR